MGNKFKGWHNQERRPKRFRKLTSMGSDSYDPNDRREKQDRKQQNDRSWQRDWHKEQ